MKPFRLRMKKPFKVRHKASGYFYRPTALAKHETTGKYVKTNLTKTGGKIYDRDPRKHILYLESHIESVKPGKVTDPMKEFEIVYYD